MLPITTQRLHLRMMRLADAPVVAKLYPGYGEMSPNGNGPDPIKIQAMGNEYLIRNFPRLDFVKTARVVQ